MNHIEITRFPETDYYCTEAMNTLCTNISYSGTEMKTVMVTSRYDKEGKSFVSMNLLRSLASLKKNVILLDADMRRSDIIGRFRLKFDGSYNGLAQYLSGMCAIDDIIYETNLDGAFFIPIGRDVLNPLPLLHSDEMQKLMKYLRESFDYVIVDTPPAGLIVDAIEIAKYCDGSLIVVSYKRGKRKDIADVKNMIEKTGCPVLGTVMNNVDLKSISSRKYYYSSERYAAEYYTKDNKKSNKKSK